MKPILYINQQIAKAHRKSIELSKYIDGNKTLRKSDLRAIISKLNYHLQEATNVFPPECENHETDEERNQLPETSKI